jgi:hypothetical protein
MLPRFPIDTLYQERAILLSRLGRHDQALHIYVRKLRNWSLAEKYCDRIWRNIQYDDDVKGKVYELLLRTYLMPDGGTESVLLEPAFQLLSRYGERIPPTLVRQICH